MARPLTKANFLILVLALLPRGAAAFFVSQDYGSVLTMSLGPKSAHEEITRQSMLDVQALLTAQVITSLSRFESQENLASNPKLRGNLAATPSFLSSRGSIAVTCSEAIVWLTSLIFGKRIEKRAGHLTQVSTCCTS